MSFNAFFKRTSGKILQKICKISPLIFSHARQSRTWLRIIQPRWGCVLQHEWQRHSLMINRLRRSRVGLRRHQRGRQRHRFILTQRKNLKFLPLLSYHFRHQKLHQMQMPPFDGASVLACASHLKVRSKNPKNFEYQFCQWLTGKIRNVLLNITSEDAGAIFLYQHNLLVHASQHVPNFNKKTPEKLTALYLLSTARVRKRAPA